MDAMHESVDTHSCPTTREIAAPRFCCDEGPDELIGRTLAGKYRLVDRIGRGAYGRVYRAEQLALHREVAVKVLDPTLTCVPDMVERFCREAFAASRIHHPNAVAIIDFGRSVTGLFFIVMEYVAGWTLGELIRKINPIPLPRVIDIAAQMLTGMEAIHEAGIIHADLKSDNIMVEPLGNGELVKVVDFGIARLRDPEHDAWPMSELCSLHSRRDGRITDRPRIGTRVCGTPGYVAPEVIGGAEPTCSGDVYAAGVVLYQLVTGRLPFTGHVAEEVLHKQVEGEALPPSCSRQGIPTSLDLLVCRAMARDPDARFASITALRQALETVAMQIAPSALPYCLCGDETCRGLSDFSSARCLICRHRRDVHHRSPPPSTSRH